MNFSYYQKQNKKASPNVDTTALQTLASLPLGSKRTDRSVAMALLNWLWCPTFATEYFPNVLMSQRQTRRVISR